MGVHALLIGCGSIGGMVDMDTDQVQSWSKAVSLQSDFTMDVFDADPQRSAAVAGRYRFAALGAIPWSRVSDYQLVIVATPTPTHFSLLSRLLRDGPGLIVCEKPVASTTGELDEVETLYRSQHSRRVMVNFHRRFQPAMARLRDNIASILRHEQCTNITITYQRGMHNNGSHALDLLQFLFGRAFELEGIHVFEAERDEFEDDPTMSLISRWGRTAVLWNGLRNLRASVFDVDIYFERRAIRIVDGGKTILMMEAAASSRAPYPLLTEKHKEPGAMSGHMLHVVEHVRGLLRDPAAPDNFLESINTSRQIVRIEKTNPCPN